MQLYSYTSFMIYGGFLLDFQEKADHYNAFFS